MLSPLQCSPFSPIAQSDSTSTFAKQLHSGYTLHDLPNRYITFLMEFGAGYFHKNKLSTIEPTRDGLDYVLLNGIFGWDSSDSNQLENDFPSILSSQFTPEHTGFPSYFIVFFADDTKYFCFDFSCKNSHDEPTIRLVDTEMDQWIWLADSFDELLNQLEEHHESILEERSIPYTLHERNQLFARTQLSQSDLNTLLSLYQDDSNKMWFFTWIDFWLHSSQPELQEIAKEHLSFQLEFMASSLVPVKKQMQQWLTDSTLQLDVALIELLQQTLSTLRDR